MSSHKHINKSRREFFRDGVYSCADPSLKSGTIAVPLTAVLCLILLAVVLKTALILPAERFSSTMTLFITAIWTVAIVFITLAIIAVSTI
jgi:hypothetical protein